MRKYKYTPDRIDRLEPNEVFVFGSNSNGQHTGGASSTAVEKFGAVWGCGEGLQGHSYAIPTTGPGTSIGSIMESVTRFIAFAGKHREFNFLVTRIGCGSAGFKNEDIAPLFEKARHLPNIFLPEAFCKIIGDSYADCLGPMTDDLADYGTFDLVLDQAINFNRDNHYESPDDLSFDLDIWSSRWARRNMYNSYMFSKLIGIVGMSMYDNRDFFPELVRILTYGKMSYRDVAEVLNLPNNASRMLIAKMLFLFRCLLYSHKNTGDEGIDFGESLACVMTGRWNCGSTDYFADDLEMSKYGIIKSIECNWKDFINEYGGLDNRKLEQLKRNPIRRECNLYDNDKLISYLIQKRRIEGDEKEIVR